MLDIMIRDSNNKLNDRNKSIYLYVSILIKPCCVLVKYQNLQQVAKPLAIA